MKWFCVSIAACLSGLAIMSGTVLAGGNGRLAGPSKMYRAPARLSQQADQYRQTLPPQHTRSRLARAARRGPSSLRQRPTRTAGQSTKTQRLGQRVQPTTSDTGASRGSRQGSVVRPRRTPPDKFSRMRPDGKLTVRPTSPTGRIRVQGRAPTQVSPQPEPPTLPLVSRARIGSGKHLKNSVAAKKLPGLMTAKQLRSTEYGIAKKTLGKKDVAAKRAAAKELWSKKPASKKPGLKKPGLKEPGSKKPGSKKPGSKPSSSGKTEQPGASGEPRPKGTITTDEEGNEHFEGTFDEEMAIANGGRYEWTDAEGNEHVTTVTPEGTGRDYVSADGTMATSGFTPHERREEVPPTDGGGWEGGDTNIVVDVLGRILPFVPGIGYFGGGLHGGGYYDPGYAAPGYYDAGNYDLGYAMPTWSEYVVSGDVGYASPASAAELIPAAAGASDRGETRFTRRLLQVTNTTDAPITVHVQFRGLQEDGRWAWLPTDPAVSQDALTFQLAAGQAGYLEHDNAAITASRVRIWAESASRQWTEYQNEDLWLVSEVDDSGQRAYFAEEMQAFPFTFQ